MKLKLQSIIATFILLAISITGIYGQANLTFSGGNGTPLSITLTQSVTYTINTECTGFAPLFVFDGAGPFSSVGGDQQVTGTVSFSINGGAAQLINRTGSNLTANGGTLTPDDIYAFRNPFVTVSNGDVIVLNAGTYTTAGNITSAAPANGSFPTFITNQVVDRCSANGVALGTTAAPVSISGRVLTNNGRGLSNALVYLTDQEGKSMMVRSNSFGHYSFADVEAGQSATINVVSKRYQFAPKVISLNEAMTELDFVAEP